VFLPSVLNSLLLDPAIFFQSDDQCPTEAPIGPGHQNCYVWDSHFFSSDAVRRNDAPAKTLVIQAAHGQIDGAAQFVNLITAWDLLNESQVQPGQWLMAVPLWPSWRPSH
jgi:hypothetical protein